MTIIVKETTVWVDHNDGKMNHYYALTDDMQYGVGYLKSDGSEYKMFSKKIAFHRKNRTFEVIQNINE